MLSGSINVILALGLVKILKSGLIYYEILLKSYSGRRLLLFGRSNATDLHYALYFPHHK